MYYSREEIFKAEHDALKDALPNEANPAYAAGYANGILRFVDNLLNGEENGRTNSD